MAGVSFRGLYLGSVLILVGIMLAVPACSSGRRKCYPVSGEIFVDGKPAADAFVYFYPVDQSEPHMLQGQAQEDGSFKISTYVSGDGAPAGDYIVTFEWPERSGLMKQDFRGADRLNKRYLDKESSAFRGTVKKEPLILPRYDLKSK